MNRIGDRHSQRADEARADACVQCRSQCCRYVALQWDRPTGKRDYDYIRWFLLHENVCVFIAPDRKWYVEFKTPCSELRADGRCAVYEQRPRICREHGEDPTTQCEFIGEGSPYQARFENARDLERYLDDKGVDWRFKPRARREAL